MSSAPQARTDAEREFLLQIKGAILDGIRGTLKTRYRQQLDACAALDLDPPRVSKIMNGRAGEFSVAYLCILAGRMGLHVTVSVN